MDHVVELAYAHSALADPVFPRLYGQARWFRSLDLAPEVVSFAGARKSLFQNTRRNSSSGLLGRLPALNRMVVFCFGGPRAALRGIERVT